MGSEPPKFRGSPNIFLCLLFAEKIAFLLVNQQNISQLKLVCGVEKKCKQNLVKKEYLVIYEILVVGSHE